MGLGAAEAQARGPLGVLETPGAWGLPLPKPGSYLGSDGLSPGGRFWEVSTQKAWTAPRGGPGAVVYGSQAGGGGPAPESS